jgi:hypothetical protein
VSALSPRSVHVTDQILAVLAEEWPLPVPTGVIKERTGYGARYGQLTYRMLQRLARRGRGREDNPARHAKPVLGASGRPADRRCR